MAAYGLEADMSDEPDTLVLIFLRRLSASMAELRADVTDIKHRVTALDIQVGQQASTEQSHYASVAIRLDRLDTRLDRLERHANIVPA